MKKLFIVSIAVVLCLGLTLPAAADVKMSGGINFLAYYLTGTPETQQASAEMSPFGLPGYADKGTPDQLAAFGKPDPSIDDRKTLQMNLSNLLTYIRGTYTNQKGTYGATIAIHGGQINNWYSGYEVQMGSTYMWWMIMPNVKVEIGKISQFIGGLGPSSIIEHTEYFRSYDPYAVYPEGIGGTPVAGLTSFGNMSTTSIPGIAIDVKVNDMVSVIFGIYDPDDDGSPGITLVTNAGGTAQEELTFPRLDIAVPIKWGNFYIQPVASYIKRKYENVVPTSDDDFGCWLIGASASVKIGPVTLSGEYVHGKNIGANNYSGPGSTSAWPQLWTDSNGYRHIEDVTDNAWWFQAKWQITPKIYIQGAYGQWKGDSDVSPSTIDDYNYKRSGYIFNLWYAVGPNFFIVPSYSHENLGSDITYPFDAAFDPDNTLEWSFGEVDFYGVGFYMVF